MLSPRITWDTPRKKERAQFTSITEAIVVATKRRKTERTRARRGERRRGKGRGRGEEEGEGGEGLWKRLMFALNPSRHQSKRLLVLEIGGMSGWNNRRVWWYGQES